MLQRRCELHGTRSRCNLSGQLIAEQVVARLRKEANDMLMPNTPIEIIAEDGRIQYAVEGNWDSCEYPVPHTHPSSTATFKSAKRHLKEILRVNARSWSGEYRYTNPDWVGWQHIDKDALTKLASKNVPYDAALEDKHC